MAKPRDVACLTPQRGEEIREAFIKWYETLEHKTNGMLALGIKPGSIGGYLSAFRSGQRVPPPWILSALWKQTQDECFLFTTQEKEAKLAQGRVKELPDLSQWPNKGEVPSSEEAPLPQEETAITVPLTDLLATHGGESSPLGVGSVIGSASFVKIDLDPSEELIKLIEGQIETSRGLLNLLAQIRDDRVRALVRARIGPQVEELELAIRLFSDIHPNRLTPLHDSQRRAWAGPTTKNS